MNAMMVDVKRMRGDDGNEVNKWFLQTVDGTTVSVRPLSFGAVLDMAEEMRPNEWAALQKAMKNPGFRVAVES